MRTRLKDDPEFRAVAAANQWFTRQLRGLPRQTSIADFLFAVYRPWIGKSMNQADLLAVDKSAWTALQNFLRKSELPFSLPKRDDTFMDGLSPEDRDLRLEARRLNRDRMRIISRLDRS